MASSSPPPPPSRAFAQFQGAKRAAEWTPRRRGGGLVVEEWGPNRRESLLLVEVTGRTGRVEDPTLQTTTPPHTMDDLRKRQQCVSHRNLGSEKCFGTADGWGDDGRIGAGSWGSDAIGAFSDPRSPEGPTAIRGQCLCAKPWSCHFGGGGGGLLIWRRQAESRAAHPQDTAYGKAPGWEAQPAASKERALERCASRE